MSAMSFLRNVNIKGSKKVAALVNALEKSAAEPKREVKFSRPVIEVRGDDVKKLLDKVKW